jgi:hypothetical protein
MSVPQRGCPVLPTGFVSIIEQHRFEVRQAMGITIQTRSLNRLRRRAGARGGLGPPHPPPRGGGGGGGVT